ncbi:hypothetical protein AB0I72_26735 [Nocardiopsis sp. NPDC049922]|uniref:phage tail tube protein n=1 Tax=Nocardiopsis sp. NPDC049922 TaxID=3155157 RepID=UPI0033F53F4E
MANNQNADAIRFAPKATIYFAPKGTDVSGLMDDVMAAIPAECTAMGYTAEDGIELTPSVETNPVNVHQSATPVKFVVASASATLAFTMMQFDENTVPVYFGTDFVDGVDGTKVLDLSSTPELAENVVIVEWGDFVEDTSGATPVLVSGTKARLIVPRGMLSERNAISLTKTDAQQLGVTIQALDLNGSLGKVLMKTADGSVPSP